MAEKGILFKPDMIRTIFDGRKTMTRRVVTEKDCWRNGLSRKYHIVYLERAYPVTTNAYLRVPYHHKDDVDMGDGNGRYRVDPPYQAGDRLYVKEALWISDCGGYYAYGEGTHKSDVIRIYDHQLFRAGDSTGPDGKPSSRFMVTAYSNRDKGRKHRFDLYCGEYDINKTVIPFEGNTEIAGVDIRFSKRRSPLFMPKWAARLWLQVTEVRVERLQEISNEDAEREGCIGDEDDMAMGYFRLLWDSINAKRGYPWGSNPWVWVISFKVQDQAPAAAPHRAERWRLNCNSKEKID